MFNISEINNPKDVYIGKESANFNRFGNLPKQSGEEVVFTSLTKPFILDHLEIATNGRTDVQFRVYLGNGGASIQRLNLLRNDGVSVDPLTARNLVDRPSPLFETAWYDEQANSYKFTLSKPLICPQGIVVAVLNTSADTDYRAGVVGFGRYI